MSNFPSNKADAVIFPGFTGKMVFIKLILRIHSFFILNEVNFPLPYPVLAMLIECSVEEDTGIRQIVKSGCTLEFQ